MGFPVNNRSPLPTNGPAILPISEADRDALGVTPQDEARRYTQIIAQTPPPSIPIRDIQGLVTNRQVDTNRDAVISATEINAFTVLQLGNLQTSANNFFQGTVTFAQLNQQTATYQAAAFVQTNFGVISGLDGPDKTTISTSDVIKLGQLDGNLFNPVTQAEVDKLKK